MCIYKSITGPKTRQIIQIVIMIPLPILEDVTLERRIDRVYKSGKTESESGR